MVMKIALRVLGIIAAIVGIFVSIGMINTSNDLKIPEKYMSVSSSSYAYDYGWERNVGAEYIGGDAYNYMIEASLKAGYYNSVVTKKTLLNVSGYLLFAGSVFFMFFSLYSLQSSLCVDKQLKAINALTDCLKSKSDIPNEKILAALYEIADNAKPISADH